MTSALQFGDAGVTNHGLEEITPGQHHGRSDCLKAYRWFEGLQLGISLPWSRRSKLSRCINHVGRFVYIMAILLSPFRP